MGDRRSSFPFRFWSSSAPAQRRTPATQSAAPPRTTTNTSPSTTTVAPPRATTNTSPSAIPSTAETQSTTTTTVPTSTTPPKDKTQTTGQTTTTNTPSTSAPANDETQTANRAATTSTPNSTVHPISETETTGQRATRDRTPISSLPAETLSSDIKTTPPTSTASPTSETKKSNQATTDIDTSPPKAEIHSQTPGQLVTPTSSENEMANQTPTIQTTTHGFPTTELQNSSPSHATTRSLSRLLPESPSPRATQSKSPPSLSYPSRPGHSSPNRTGPESPSTPQKATKPRPPSLLASGSPKQTSSPSKTRTQPPSPPKELQRRTEDRSQPVPMSSGSLPSGSNEELKFSTSAQQPDDIQLKAEAKPDTADDSNNQTAIRRDTKLKEMEVGSSNIQNAAQGPMTPATKELYSSYVNHEPDVQAESNVQPEETKEVMEVVHETKNEDNETMKKVNDLLPMKSRFREHLIGEASIDNKSIQMHKDKQAALSRNGMTGTSLSNGKPVKGHRSHLRNTNIISDNHKRSPQSSGEHEPLQKEIRDELSTFVNQMATGGSNNSLYDRPVSVITLAGENRGATMQIGSESSRREGPIHIHRGYKTNPDESAAATDGEGSLRGKKSEDEKATEDLPTEAYVNNNAQGINNSIVFNSSITEGNPGVHMVLTHTPKEPRKSTDEKQPIETRKSEFNITPSQKLTYEPTIRRRCLRGFFLEPSDSDPDNPQKPQRHGCRVGCKGKSKQNEIDVL